MNQNICFDTFKNEAIPYNILLELESGEEKHIEEMLKKYILFKVYKSRKDSYNNIEFMINIYLNIIKVEFFIDAKIRVKLIQKEKKERRKSFLKN